MLWPASNFENNHNKINILEYNGLKAKHLKEIKYDTDLYHRLYH